MRYARADWSCPVSSAPTIHRSCHAFADDAKSQNIEVHFASFSFRAIRRQEERLIMKIKQLHNHVRKPVMIKRNFPKNASLLPVA
jgi:hypothetical protein